MDEIGFTHLYYIDSSRLFSLNRKGKIMTAELLEPTKLYSDSMVLSGDCPVPKERGLCAWYFKEIPGITPTDGCVVKDDLTLLYLGSTGNLRERVTYHFRGNAEGSTLRRTLGVLLAEESGFPLRRVGIGKSMTFTKLGENWLNNWMQQNALVCWMIHLEPEKAKLDMIKNKSLPLNIENNGHHPFSKILSEMRREATHLAREMPIVR